MKFDPTYRVMLYSEDAFRVGNIALTRDELARLAGWFSPQVLRNTVRFCNDHGVSDLRELAAFRPAELEQDDKIGRRTVYAVARILNTLAPNALRGRQSEWKIENAGPLTSEEAAEREKRAELIKQRAGGERARQISRRGESERFTGSVRKTPRRRG